MNNEEFVTYNQAVKLRELGFSWPCAAYYTKEDAPGGEAWLARAPDLSRQQGWPGRWPAPELHKARKWLREIKGWHIEVRINGTRNMFAVMLWEMKPNGYCEHIESPDGRARLYDRYEDALSDGISEALKLIEEEER